MGYVELGVIGCVEVVCVVMRDARGGAAATSGTSTRVMM